MGLQEFEAIQRFEGLQYLFRRVSWASRVTVKVSLRTMVSLTLRLLARLEASVQ